MNTSRRFRWFFKISQGGRPGLVIVLMMLFSFVHLSQARGQDPSSPQIVIPEKTFRSEPVEEGQSLEHTFTVLNKGREPLQIIKVNPG
jgi:hypothetical protein